MQPLHLRELSYNSISQICHDIAGDLTVITNSLELVKDPKSTWHEQACYLTELALKSMILKVKLFRQIYSLPPSQLPSSNIEELTNAIGDVYGCEIRRLNSTDILSLDPNLSNILLVLIFRTAKTILKNGTITWNLLNDRRFCMTVQAKQLADLNENNAILQNVDQQYFLSPHNACVYYARYLIQHNNLNLKIRILAADLLEYELDIPL